MNFLITVILAIFSLSAPKFQEPATPLAPFEQLIGSKWCLDNSCQTFEWGVGKGAVIGKSYIVQGSEMTLVSEGMWFWHPGEKRIKGYFNAINMPVNFFEYTTRFEKNEMINELMTYAPGEEANTYLETWVFTNVDTYHWQLFENESDKEPMMQGKYVRKD